MSADFTVQKTDFSVENHTEVRLMPYYDHAGITIYNADCRDVLPCLPKVDLVLTDPPYGISAKIMDVAGVNDGKSRAIIAETAVTIARKALGIERLP